VLVIPRRHIGSVNELKDADGPLIGQLYMAAQKVARAEGIAETGYRLVMNNGAAAGQTVEHIHLHVLGGRSMHWPPG
jgi:histidine triad (HIT) family protein